MRPDARGLAMAIVGGWNDTKWPVVRDAIERAIEIAYDAGKEDAELALRTTAAANVPDLVEGPGIFAQGDGDSGESRCRHWAFANGSVIFCNCDWPKPTIEWPRPGL